VETRDKHCTPTRVGTVFAGTGMKKYTRGLPVSHPNILSRETFLLQSRAHTRSRGAIPEVQPHGYLGHCVIPPCYFRTLHLFLHLCYLLSAINYVSSPYL
jgi:hypothetical protein